LNSKVNYSSENFLLKDRKIPNSESNFGEILAARIAGLGLERHIDNENMNL
jgi:hypothetical protein